MKSKHLIDLHIHSNFSDGRLSISEIVDLYGTKKFSAIAITDHLADSKTLTGLVSQKLRLSLTKKNMDQYLSTLRREAIRAWNQYQMILIPGVEVTLNSWSRRQGAHVVMLGATEYINPDQSIEDLLKAYSDLFSIAAHPLWEKAFEFKTTYLWDNRHTLAPLFDAWECGTGSFFSKEVYLSGLAVVASSDFHGSKNFESWKTAAYLEELSIDGIYEAIRTRNTEPVWI